MTAATMLTLGRIALALAGSGLLLLSGPPLVAAILFAVAALTDAADGRLARATGTVTPAGSFLDPLADKILVLLYLAALAPAGVFAAWMLWATLARELVNDGLRSWAALRGRAPGAIRIAKAKTALQMAAIVAGLLALAGIPELLVPARWLLIASLACGWIATLLFAPACLRDAER